ncbi:DEAD box ATP-dependent RNA helicase, putative [Schistosoma mansoni]|nr:DEAD box ATP-dependent RNA helicase, putative [Schistosoma mansoni]|eukprot:XP_018644845.1 DEAD box ATP-dependent RNA helicase, putative [Schistosoma mansoni]
MNKTYCFFMN